MFDPFWRRAALAMTTGLALVAGLARSNEPNPPQFTTVVPREVPARWPVPPNPHFYHDVKHASQCVGCWSHHNSYTCSSFRAEMRFIFGGCRAFYGEPCLKTPIGYPPGFGAPVPPSEYGAAGPGPAYGAAPGSVPPH